MTTPQRSIPTVTIETARTPEKLYRYLTELERALVRVLGDKPAPAQMPETFIDFAEIRAALSFSGTHPLNVTNLIGKLADSQLAGILIASSDPSVTAYPIGTLLVVTGSPDTFKYLKAGTPNTWQAISTSPSNMMTTDTDQTPGATVVKTWTARQIFNGGLDAGGQVHVTAGGIDVDAGGINVDAGGATITGNSTITGTLLVTLLGTFSSGIVVNGSPAQLTVGAVVSGGALTVSDTLELTSIFGVASSPFTVTSETYVYVDTTAARTVNLPASPNLGRVIIIKDNTGGAAANNITVSGNGNNIDGAASTVVAVNFDVRRLIFNGTQWNIV